MEGAQRTLWDGISTTPRSRKRRVGSDTEKSRAATKRWRKKNIERVRERDRLRYQNNLEKVKARRSTPAYKEKQRERQKRYRQNNREKVNASSKRYRENNPEKAREAVRRHKEKHPEKVKAAAKKFAANNPEKLTLWARRRKGIKDATGEKRTGQCPFCLQEKMKLVLDHDHDIGLTRGWLCDRCNLWLEHLINMEKRQTGALDRVISYLDAAIERWREQGISADNPFHKTMRKAS